MEYENDVMAYTGAVAMAVGAAMILKRPRAWAIALAIGLLVCNPDSMKKCAAELRGEGKGGTEADRHRIEAEIADLKNKIKADKHWEGEDADAFNAAADKFLAELHENQKYRTCAADTLDQNAHVGHGGANLVVIVALAMGAMATASVGSRLSPQLHAAVELNINRVLGENDRSLMAVVRRNSSLVGVAGALLATVNVFQYNQGRLFMGMKALPEKEPDFTQAGLQYDKKSSHLKKVSA